MKFRLLFAAIVIASTSACAPQVLCPAYAIEDAPTQEVVTDKEQAM